MTAIGLSNGEQALWARRVARDNAWPRKQPERKLGAAVALLVAVGRAMTDDGIVAGSTASSPGRSARELSG
jgi:hypothetical protein